MANGHRYIVKMTLNQTKRINWTNNVIGFYVDASSTSAYHSTSLSLNGTKVGEFIPAMSTFPSRKVFYYPLVGGLYNPDTFLCKDKNTPYLVCSKMDTIHLTHHSSYGNTFRDNMISVSSVCVA